MTLSGPPPRPTLPDLQGQLAPSPGGLPPEPKTGKLSPVMKLALELGPLAIFFVANYVWGIFPATAVLMVAVSAALAANYLLERTLPVMPIVTAVMVLVFGGLTLILHDELFIKIKPTIVNTLFSATLLIGLALGRPLIKLVMEHAIQLPDFAWRALTWRYAFLFAFLAILNEAIWRNFSTDTWVAFKVWGVFPLTLVFTMLQIPYISKYQIQPDGPSQRP